MNLFYSEMFQIYGIGSDYITLVDLRDILLAFRSILGLYLLFGALYNGYYLSCGFSGLKSRNLPSNVHG